MRKRSPLLLVAVLSACAALVAGVIGGALASGGSSSSKSSSSGTSGSGSYPTSGTRKSGDRRGHRFRFGPGRFGLDADTIQVLRDVHEAIEAKAPGIAKPVLDKAVADNEISQEQADRLAKLVAHQRLSAADFKALFSDVKAAPVLFEVKAALARQAPDIVKPIVDKAVSDGKLTRAQGDRLIAASAWGGDGPGFGPGPRGFHHGPPPGPPGPPGP